MGRQSQRKKGQTVVGNPVPPVPPKTGDNSPASGGGRLWVILPIVLPIVLSGIAIVIAVWAGWSTQRQTDITAEAADRATGKIAAKFELAEYRPLPTDFRKEHWVQLPLAAGQSPYYPDANQLVLNPPVVWINNTGTDAIDAVKVETTFLEGFIDSKRKLLDAMNPPKDWYKEDTPVILRRSERDEHVLQRQLQPGMSLGIPLLRGVLSHIAQAQSRKQTDAMHYARMKTAVTCRLTSSTAYSSDGSEIAYLVNWLPSGFGADEVKRVLDAYQPNLVVGPKKEVVLQKKWASEDESLLPKGTTTNLGKP